MINLDEIEAKAKAEEILRPLGLTQSVIAATDRQDWIERVSKVIEPWVAETRRLRGALERVKDLNPNHTIRENEIRQVVEQALKGSKDA
jgi:hypothetical protein